MKNTSPAVVRTGSGRIRRFVPGPDGYTERLATRIQGTGADGLKAAIVLMRPELKKLGARIVLAVHDELLVEAPVGVAQQVLELVRTLMIEGMQRWVKNVPIEVDAEIRTTWAA